MTLDKSKQGTISDKDYQKHEVVIRQIILSKFLQAMREDLSEWISSLAFHLTVTPENFLDNLDNGIILCQQARFIQRYAEEYAVLNPDKRLKIPAREVYYTEKGASPGSFVARDNVANFIYWCRELGIPDVVIFESEDLVLHKNEKSVLLTLLDVARKAYTFGVQPPEIVRFEKEIDDEIERDKEDEKMGRPPPKPRDLEEDNNLDTMVRNIVNRCTCCDRFPIKKLAEGKYKIGKADTLIFVRVMRKHVMVRVGGGWDTLDHYITKHDPCRTKIAGNIEENGRSTGPAPPSVNLPTPRKASHSTSTPRKKSLTKKEFHKCHHEPFSTNSSDTWSMCSGSSDGSGSLDSSRNDCSCGSKDTYKNIHRKSSAMSTSSTATDETSGNSDVAVSFTKSIEEIDHKLKLLENNNPAMDLTLKDTSVYDNKNDKWLRSHLNSIKERRLVVGPNGEDARHPLGEFVMRRGYTADVIERPTVSKERRHSHTNKKEAESNKARSRTKTAPESISQSLDQGLNQGYYSLPRPLRKSKTKGEAPVKRRGHSPLSDGLSLSNQSLNSSASEPFRKSCSDMSTQTEPGDLRTSSGIPRALKKMDSMGSQSKIPRPSLQRSNTMDGASRLRKRNFVSSDKSPCKTPMRREKSDLTGGRITMRREKSDITGRHTKNKQSAKNAPRRVGTSKHEKPVRVRNGAVLDVV